MTIQFTAIFQCKTIQNIPQLVFLVWKYTIWQPCFEWNFRRLCKCNFFVNLFDDINDLPSSWESILNSKRTLCNFWEGPYVTSAVGCQADENFLMSVIWKLTVLCSAFCNSEWKCRFWSLFSRAAFYCFYVTRAANAWKPGLIIR
jgi:hypothetical protein